MTHARVFLGATLIVIALGYTACGSREIGTPTGPTAIDISRASRDDAPAIDVHDPGEIMPEPVAPPEILIGAGDLSQCGLEGVVKTGRLLDALLRQARATAVTFGDNSNDDGSAANYQCFDRWWGAYK